MANHLNSPSHEAVTLVIPGRNCASTIKPCLNAVVPLLEKGVLEEIIFVDDGSTDETPTLVRRFPVRCVRGAGRGPAAARNLGWQSAQTPLVWFVDSDCVAQGDALTPLLGHIGDERVGGVSGTYTNENDHSLIASLIHEEIVERHRVMPTKVDFLATFNVLYRRKILERLEGFDERYLKAQDAELSFRVMRAGFELHFDRRSKVGHFHETHLLPYLRVQRQQGYWRVWLHIEHSGHTAGDSYSSLVDHLQPPLAMVSLAAAPCVFLPVLRWLPGVFLLALCAAQLPLTARILARTGKVRFLAFIPFGIIRSFWRGVGLTHGTLSYLFACSRRRANPDGTPHKPT